MLLSIYGHVARYQRVEVTYQQGSTRNLTHAYKSQNLLRDLILLGLYIPEGPLGTDVKEVSRLVFRRAVMPTTAALTTDKLEKGTITLYFSMLQKSLLNFIRYFNTKHTLK